MNRLFQANAIAAVAMALVSPFIAESNSRSHRLDEDDALDLLERTLKSDSIYEKRILSDCIAPGTEETTNAYFGFSSRNPLCQMWRRPRPDSRYRSVPGLSTFR